MISEFKTGLADLRQGLGQMNLALLLAIDGLKRSHRRTELGILWLVVPQAVVVISFIWIFTQVFQQQVEGFPLYIGTGILVWSYIATIITGAPLAVLGSARWILSQPLPLSTLIYSFLVQSTIQFLLLTPIYLGLLIFYATGPSFQGLLAIPGLVIISAVGIGFSMVFGPLGARFRDLGPALGVCASVAFLITPVIWPASVVGRRVFFIHGNPFYHLVEIVRQPLMGNYPTLENWIFSGVLAISMIFAGIVAFGWFRRHVYYWVS